MGIVFCALLHTNFTRLLVDTQILGASDPMTKATSSEFTTWISSADAAQSTRMLLQLLIASMRHGWLMSIVPG
jgi:hypothetical protein